MTGVLALGSYLTVVPVVAMFFGGILLLSLGLIAARAVFGARREHGNVLDINAAARAQAAAKR